MKRLAAVVTVVTLMLSTAYAEFTWSKKIDVSGVLPTGSRVKDVIADSSGNLYFTANFGTGDVNQIWKITNPLSASPAISLFNTDGGYASSNAAALAVDNGGNVYLAFDTSDAATSWIKKYDSAGNLVSGFGTAGKLSPVVVGGVNYRPRDIGWTDATSNKLLVSTFSTPYQYGVVSAATGADAGTIAWAKGDTNDDGVIGASEVDTYNGIAYNPATNTIYAEAQADLVALTGSSATLNDPTSFTNAALLTQHARLNTSGNGLSFDVASGLIAYTALREPASVTKVGVYDLATGKEEMVGGELNADGYLNLGASPSFFRSSSNLYLAATNYTGAAIEVFSYEAPIKDRFSAKWVYQSSLDTSSTLPSGSKLKDVAADASGNIYFTSNFGTGDVNQIWKITGALTASPVISQFNTDGGYPSTNAASISIDASGNVYLAVDTGDAATSWIKKYDSSGALVSAFGASGKLSPVVNNGANVRPRMISVTNAASNVLMVSTFGTPYTLGAVNATTGADGGATLVSLGDSGDNGALGASEASIYNGMAYDAANNAIYANAQGDLMRLTGASAVLSNIPSFDIITLMTSHNYKNVSENNLRLDSEGRWAGYTAIKDGCVVLVGVYDIAAGVEEFVGGPLPSSSGALAGGGACAFLKAGGSDYLAVTSINQNAIKLFKYTPPPPPILPSAARNWSMYE